jgi:hypothetical protein
MINSKLLENALRAATRPVLVDTQEALQAAARAWAAAPTRGRYQFLRATYRAALGLAGFRQGAGMAGGHLTCATWTRSRSSSHVRKP